MVICHFSDLTSYDSDPTECSGTTPTISGHSQHPSEEIVKSVWGNNQSGADKAENIMVGAVTRS